MKQALKNTLPPRLVQWLGNTYDAIRRLPDQPAAYLHPWRRESIRKLAALKDSTKANAASSSATVPA